MKVRELKEILNIMDDNDDVIVDVHDRDIINPSAEITKVHEGFDWFDGCVVLYTRPRLTFLKEK